MPALREHLLPRAPRLTPAELVDQADAYARTTGYPVQYQWTLLDGVNDSDDELAGIERLLAGRFGVLNLIPWNTVDGDAVPAPQLGARRRDGAAPAPPRHPDQAAAFGRAGCGGRLRPAAGAAP
jgi:adenine C2-methylase RlmN of 23S rRNA A2503 and tRNA A37